MLVHQHGCGRQELLHCPGDDSGRAIGEVTWKRPKMVATTGPASEGRLADPRLRVASSGVGSERSQFGNRRQSLRFPVGSVSSFAKVHTLVACNGDIGIGFLYHEACLQESFA